MVTGGEASAASENHRTCPTKSGRAPARAREAFRFWNSHFTPCAVERSGGHPASLHLISLGSVAGLESAGVLLPSPKTMCRKELLLIVGILAVGAAILPILSYATNCGGNSAALAQVRSIALIAFAGIDDAPNHAFRF